MTGESVVRAGATVRPIDFMVSRTRVGTRKRMSSLRTPAEGAPRHRVAHQPGQTSKSRVRLCLRTPPVPSPPPAPSFVPR